MGTSRGPCLDTSDDKVVHSGMPKIHASWWNLVLDGKLHHIERGRTPYGSIASLRTAIYRQALDRGLQVATHLDSTDQVLFLQTWKQFEDEVPSALARRQHESTPAPSTSYRPPSQQRVAAVPRPASPTDRRALEMLEEEHEGRMAKAQAEVQAAGLDPYDVDLVEERTYCTCGLGNATGNKRHDPSCQVWS